jgi:hypothetical protein
VNWNQDLIWKMRSELDFQWELVEEEAVDIFKVLLESLVSELILFKAQLEGNALLRSSPSLNPGLSHNEHFSRNGSLDRDE